MTTLIERLDPEIQKPITTLLNAPAMSFDDLPAARAASRKMMQEMKKRMPPFQGVASNDRKVPGPAGAPDVKLRIYRPEQKSGRLPALLWIHGGGYMLGDLDQEDTICQQYSLSAGCVVVSVDYRLSPENPYPAPLDDCYAGLQWLASHTEDLEVDLARIAIGGASAG
ncbi:MAG TPA: alpha/beta hydrolase fold domain-containing protein, partial [Dehalococcoidales bacterium]|nr:alpha/beta hydrolase fold domain-containing protein [Dehalococcoidales bacterium]